METVESERAFVRYAHCHLRAAFSRLPERSQLNRLIRSAHDLLVAVVQGLVLLLGSQQAAYEMLDGMGVALRNNRRPGRSWLDGVATIGWSPRLG
jgi:hypothetical protein